MTARPVTLMLIFCLISSVLISKDFALNMEVTSVSSTRTLNTDPVQKEKNQDAAPMEDNDSDEDSDQQEDLIDEALMAAVITSQQPTAGSLLRNRFHSIYCYHFSKNIDAPPDSAL